MLDFDEFYYTDFVDEKQLKEKNNSGKKTYVSTNRTENDITIKKFNILTSNNPFNKKIGNYISIDFQNVDTIENTLNIILSFQIIKYLVLTENISVKLFFDGRIGEASTSTTIIWPVA